MTIRTLEQIPFEQLFRAFEEAFADYDVRFEAAEVRAMLQRRGFDPARSFAAFDGDTIAAFILNGIGLHNGIPTAYDTGTGTVKRYRGRGLATQLFREAEPRLRAAGIGQYLLEVLQHNERALALYRSLGFETVRELACYRLPISEVRFPAADPAAPAGLTTPCEPAGPADATSLADPAASAGHLASEDLAIAPLDPTRLAEAAAFDDFPPSWQNSLDSIRRAGDDLRMLGAFDGGRLVGYGVFDPLSGDLTRLATAPDRRRHGIATRLLREMLQGMQCRALKLLNADSACDSLHAFLAARGIPLASRQYEMIKTL